MTFLTYFSFAMSFISLWIHRSIWLWGSFLATSLIVAFQAGIANPFILIPISALAGIHFLMKQAIAPPYRWLLFLIATTVSILLIFHLVPGFCSWNVSGNFWIRYDSPFIGLFVLAFALPLARSPSDWFSIAFKAVPLTILGISLLIFPALSSGAVTFEPKILPHFLLRTIVNLIFVCIPEEAFFRGFVQEELFKRLGGRFLSAIGAILLTSIFFTLCHLKWTSSPALLTFVFLASLLYGILYQYTRAIESSIFCHFSLNLVHMLFFFYHAA